MIPSHTYTSFFSCTTSSLSETRTERNKHKSQPWLSSSPEKIYRVWLYMSAAYACWCADLSSINCRPHSLCYNKASNVCYALQAICICTQLRRSIAADYVEKTDVSNDKQRLRWQRGCINIHRALSTNTYNTTVIYYFPLYTWPSKQNYIWGAGSMYKIITTTI